MSDADRDRGRQRMALVLFIVLLLVLVGAVGWAARGTTSSSDTAAIAPVASASAPIAAAEVMLVPISTAQDPFTSPMGVDAALPAMAAAASTGLIDVGGDAVGLYGGTLKKAASDPTKLVAYLAAHPDKARAWASALGITPAQIPTYVNGLTPVILRTDTLVTVHGYRNGHATSFPAVLQAGSAVLVDGSGVPVVHSYSGNPLTPAPDISRATTITGTPWKGFSFGTTVRVRPAHAKVEGFTMVDITKGTLFTRPVGSMGKQDADTGQPAPQGIAGTPAPVVEPPATTEPAATGIPAPNSAPTPGSTERPAGDPVTLFEVGSIAGVSSGPPKPTTFTLDSPAYLTAISNYHYLNGGSGPGTIGLKAADGTLYGPWQATGSEGQGGVANATWTVTPNVVIPAGTYTVVDSNHGTWSWAVDTKQRGMSSVQGIPVPAASPPSPTAPAAPAPPVPSAGPPAAGGTKSSRAIAFSMADPEIPPEGAINGYPGSPGRPTVTSVEASWDRKPMGGTIWADVTWTPPADPGSSPITGYYVCLAKTWNPEGLNDAVCFLYDADARSASVADRGLLFADDPPHDVKVFVAAVNDTGIGRAAIPVSLLVGCDVYGPETGAQNMYKTLCLHQP